MTELTRLTNIPSAEDPLMVNLKGVQVRVPVARVQDLLKKGFRLVEEDNRPKANVGRPRQPFAPLTRYPEKKEELRNEDLLNVVEV